MRNNKFLMPIIMLLLSIISFMLSKNTSIIICCICFTLYFLNSFINIKTHFLSMLFGISCFGFLFGSIVFNPNVINDISEENIVLYCSILSLSITFIQFGSIFVREQKMENERIKQYRNQYSISLVYKTSKKIFWFTFIFCVLEALIRAKYMMNYGYVYLYNHPSVMTTGLNGIITDLSMINNISLTILLSCLPKTKNVKKEFIATFIYGALILLSGARAKLVNFIFLFVSYQFLTIYSYENKNINFKKIIKYSLISICLIAILSSVFLNVVSYRSGGSSNTSNNSVVELITSEGGTWKIVINSFYIYQRTTTSQHILFYSIPFIKTITLQPFLNKLGIGFLPTNTYTSDYALHSYDYSSFYAYSINPSLYLSGGGLGSSYLAESYMFGKIFGVIFHSFIIGFFFAKVSSNNKKYTLLRNAYVLSVLSNIFWSPRASALASFFTFFSFSNIVVWLCIYVLINLTLTKNKEAIKDGNSTFCK